MYKRQAQRAGEWNTAPGRTPMRDEILALPDGAALWQRFQEYDRQMTATLGRESREGGIQIVRWSEADTVERVSERVLRPVSYTHLDVYKRQACGGASAMGRFRCRRPFTSACSSSYCSP